MEKIFILFAIIGIGLIMETAYAYGGRNNRSEGSSMETNMQMQAGGNFSDDLSSMRSAGYQNKESFIRTLENRKENISRELERLKAQNQTADLKEKIQQKTDDLREIDQQIMKARQATESNWEKVRDSIYNNFNR